MADKTVYQKEIRIPNKVIDAWKKINAGQFTELFKEADGVLGKEPKVYDYHNLYKWCLEWLINGLQAEFFFNPHGDELPMQSGKIDMLPDGSSTYVYDGDEPGKRPLSDKSFLYFIKRKKELDAAFDVFARKIESPNDKLNKILEELNDIKKNNNRQELLPELEVLNKLTEGKEPALRKWNGGKYKCGSLETFIKAYIKIADNLTPALIRDYLISERKGKPFANSTIEKCLTLYGPGRK